MYEMFIDYISLLIAFIIVSAPLWISIWMLWGHFDED